MPKLRRSTTEPDDSLHGLRILPPPEPHWEFKNGAPTLDIIAIHGLNGNPLRTWTYPDPRANNKNVGVHWLRDLLPYKVPRARIMTFGFHANVVGNTSSAGIMENARSLLSYLVSEREKYEERQRPILWIGHSLGGIILKQALIYAADEPAYSCICPASTSIMFFGTPHRGSSIADWGNQLAAIGRVAFRLNASDTYLKVLKSNSAQLSEINEAFLNIASRFHIVSFCEELQHPVLGRLVVTHQSATLQIPNEEVVMINDSDHCSMCRFKSQDDVRFSLVWKRILKFNQSSTEVKTVLSFTTAQTRCLSSLFLKDARDVRELADSLRCAGTNDWIFDSNPYLEWENSERNSLHWIIGGPGYGKTVLSTAIIDHLECSDNARVKNYPVVFFFWDDKNELQNTGLAMYRTILWQLLRHRGVLFRHVLNEFEIQGPRLFESSQSLTRLLTNVLEDANVSGLYLVLDGLDECEEQSRHDVVRFLKGLSAGSGMAGKAKTVILSRKYDGIDTDLEGQSVLTLTPDILQGDINKFVKKRVKDISRVRHYDQSLASRVEDVVSIEANGMFLWASLMLRELEKTPLRTVNSKLKSPPRGLRQVYESILGNIPEEAREIARDILRWVATATRPLTLDELGALTVASSEKDVPTSVNSDFMDIEGDVQFCGPILVIRDRSVQIVHQSAKDFLVERSFSNKTPSLSSFFSVDLEKSHEQLARLCIGYLTQPDFASGPLPIEVRYGNDEVIDKHCARFPLLRYAAANWLHHARLSNNVSDLCRDIERFGLGSGNPAFKAWFSMYWFSRETYLHCPKGFTPVHMAAHFHLHQYLERHLDAATMDVLEPIYYGTPLHAAAWAGNVQSVQLLIHLGASVDIIGGRYGTALQAAAANGHDLIVSMLLNAGATVNIFPLCGAHGAPLLAAALKGHTGIAQQLLSHGAFVNTYQTDGFFGLALKAAAEHGHKSIVNRLLRADTDVHAQAQGVDYGTALAQACAVGQEDVVDLLLASGMEHEGATRERNETVQRYDFGTALQAAVSVGNVDIARLLITAGADVEARGERNGSALVIASSLGHLTMMQTLLDAGASVSSASGGFGTPLIAASAYGRVDAVKLLLTAGAEVNQRGGFLGYALRAAANFGHVAVVDVLLAAGGEDSTDGVLCNSALEAATEAGNRNVVSTLLRHKLTSKELSAPDPVDIIASLNELHGLLAGPWRGYYFYAEGNMARDEGEVVFELTPDNPSSAVSSSQNSDIQSRKGGDTRSIGGNALISIADSTDSMDINKAPSINGIVRPFLGSDDEAAQKLHFTGHGADKWGEFVIDGLAILSDDGGYATAIFDKNYASWGWTYKGRINKTRKAIGGTWGRDGQETHGTFAFYRA